MSILTTLSAPSLKGDLDALYSLTSKRSVDDKPLQRLSDSQLSKGIATAAAGAEQKMRGAFETYGLLKEEQARRKTKTYLLIGGGLVAAYLLFKR